MHPDRHLQVEADGAAHECVALGYEYKVGAGLCACSQAFIVTIKIYAATVRANESQHKTEQRGLAYAGLTHEGGLGAGPVTMRTAVLRRMPCVLRHIQLEYFILSLPV